MATYAFPKGLVHRTYLTCSSKMYEKLCLSTYINILIKLLSYYLLLLLVIQISIPSIAQGDGMAPRTYRVPKECNLYVNEIEKYNWNTSIVIQIMKKESGCSPKAVNWNDHHRGCDGSFNILQIACIHYEKGESRKDPSLAIAKGYELYVARKGSFKDWSTCKDIKGCV